MTNRVLLGQEPGGNYVFKVSRTGINVLTASDEDLIFNSDAPEAGLILASGSTTLTISGGTGETPIINFPTTYDFKPIVLISRMMGSGITRNAPEAEFAVSSSGDIKTGLYFRSTTSIRVFTVVYNYGFTIKTYESAGSNSGSARPALTDGTHTFNYIVLNIGGATSS